MTGPEYHLLRQSARLCEARINLAAQIRSLQAAYAKMQQQIDPDPVQKATQKARNVVKRKKPHKFSHVFLALLAASVPCAAIALIQIRLLPSSIFLRVLNPVCSIAVWILVYVVLNKRYREKLFLQYRAHYQNEYVRRSEEAERKCGQLQAQIQDLYSQYTALECRMQDPAQCCIPRQHWNIGPRLFQIVDTGAARSLHAAIEFYHQPKKPRPPQQPRKPIQWSPAQPTPQVNTAADEARWRELQKMMDEQNAALARERQQFLDSMQEAAIAYLLADALED